MSQSTFDIFLLAYENHINTFLIKTGSAESQKKWCLLVEILQLFWSCWWQWIMSSRLYMQGSVSWVLLCPSHSDYFEHSTKRKHIILFFFYPLTVNFIFSLFFLFSLKSCIHVSHFHYPLITWWTSILFPIEQWHRWTSISTVRDRALWVYTQEWYSWMLKNILFSI